jgi:hypothetical protein
MALLLPVVALGASDLVIGTYHPGIMVAVYACMAFPIVWRSLLRRRLTAARVGLCAVCGTVAFFLGTNLAVWLFSPLYERTVAGLAACYVAAIPFARNTLSSDLIWSAVFFGTYVLAVRLAHRKAPVPAQASV